MIPENKSSSARARELYNQATKNQPGFVIRDKQYGRMLEIRKRIQPEKSIVTDKGYTLLREDEGNMYVKARAHAFNA